MEYKTILRILSSTKVEKNSKMKKSSFLVFIIVLSCSYSCNFKNREKDKIGTSQAEYTLNKKKEVRKEDFKISDDSIATVKIDSDRQLSFKFNVDSSGYFLKSIIIYSDNIPVQIIHANKEIERKYFQLFDWNFDGYKDISVLSNCGSGGCAYWIWNYSKENGKYFYNKELSEHLGLEIDTISRYIIFHYRAGYSEEYWDSLQYKNDKLSFVKGLFRERWSDTLGYHWVKNTRSKMINNKLVTKVDSSITK
jgi:hypothetical protein